MHIAQRLLRTAHIASDFTRVNCTAAGTLFGTTDVYEVGFSYLSISIFMWKSLARHQKFLTLFHHCS